ncbi:MAG: BlaI/MecI/CopY family transcriptional regulator [Gemmatimonadales bacterium]
MSDPYAELGARERQIMDVLFRQGTATAQEVQDGLTDPPSYSAVRGMLRLLEEKGYVRHEWDGPRYVYRPTVNRGQLQRSAAAHMLQTFFNNSMESAMAAMLGVADRPPTADEIDRMTRLLERARRAGKGKKS